jgi:hypothetical protein
MTSALYYLKGAIRLLQAAVGAGKAPDAVITERRRLCNTCYHRHGPRCGICGCFIWAKTKLNDEECPIEEW